MNTAPPPFFGRHRRLPTRRQWLIVLFIAVQLSWALHGLSGSPFLSIVLRIVFIAACLLLAFVAAATVRVRALPAMLVRHLAVAVTAPLATLAIFVLTESGGGVAAMLQPQPLYGYLMLGVLSLVLGQLAALVALRFERKARERDALAQAERQRHTLERELLDARLHLLQAQIAPHFLFNTLANIQALVEAKSDNAAPVLRHLIAYLRAAMPRLADADATLGSELQLVRAYLELMHLRMPDRLRFSVACAPQLEAIAFPPMALLTLVENAVRHGIDPSIAGGRIDVGARVDGASGTAIVSVADTGPGMSESAQPGTGLANVRKRLLAFYGPAARLDLHEQDPHGLHVELTFVPRSAP